MDRNLPLTDTILFALSEVKSLPSRKGSFYLIVGIYMTQSDNRFTGGIHAPYTMPLR